jgi:DNA repair protein RecO (recombination protein O)
MKYKSLAITLTYIKQGESSIISKILTEEKGLQTFIIKGVRSKNSKKKLSYFEPLKLLNIDANFDAKKSLQYLGDVTVAYCINSPINKIRKNFIAFFIAEVGSKVLQENEQNTAVFNFIWNTTIKLYSEEKIDPNFALKYLLNLSKFLGFYPSLAEINKPFFNLEIGDFFYKKDSTKDCISKGQSNYLKALLNKKKITIPQEQKSELLKEILRYYKLHYYNLDDITSHLVIETLRK